MTIEMLIDSDSKDLKLYFQKNFELLKQSQINETNMKVEGCDGDATSSLDSKARISHLIKPDMIINIYSFLEFWLQKICNFYEKNKNLNLSYKDIKGNNDLNTYHKYFTKVVGLNLNHLQTTYEKLNELREIRNKFIHNGGYVTDEEAKKFKSIATSNSLLSISEDYIYEILQNAKDYLIEIISHFPKKYPCE